MSTTTDSTSVISAEKKSLRLKRVLSSLESRSDMLILSVDPGANGTGWAMLRASDGHLWNFGTLHGRSKVWANKAQEILTGYRKILSNNYIGQIFIESPVFMRGYGGYTTASTGDLVKLAMLCGAIYFQSVREHGTVLVEPSTWKGQLPKKVCASRIMRILHAQSTYEPLGRVSNHAIDAIGLGLWALGRFK